MYVLQLLSCDYAWIRCLTVFTVVVAPVSSPHGHVAAVYDDGSQSVLVLAAVLSGLQNRCRDRHLNSRARKLLEVSSGQHHRHGHGPLLHLLLRPGLHQLPQNFICVRVGAKLLLDGPNLSCGVAQLVEEVHLGVQGLELHVWVGIIGIHFLTAVRSGVLGGQR